MREAQISYDCEGTVWSSVLPLALAIPLMHCEQDATDFDAVKESLIAHGEYKGVVYCNSVSSVTLCRVSK